MTQEFLLRPMGIFQLVDYVGVDVCQRIQGIMTTYLSGGIFADPLIDSMVEAQVLGGQYADGLQKDGIFRYDKGKPIAVYDVDAKNYVTTSSDKLGALSQKYLSWKILSKENERKEKIASYFNDLANDKTLGAELSWNFLKRSREIAYLLVDSGVARSLEDVNVVLEKGFFHLYGVEEPFRACSS